MMTIQDKAKLDNKIMKAMKVGEIRHVVAETNKGQLNLMLALGGTHHDYKFVLDAVPFDEKTNKQLIEFFDGILYEL